MHYCIVLSRIADPLTTTKLNRGGGSTLNLSIDWRRHLVTRVGLS